MEGHEAHRAPPVAARGPARAQELAPLALMTVLWCIVMSQVGQREMYTIVGGYALAAGALVGWLFRPALESWFRVRARYLAIGAGVCVAMTALTYPLYQLAVQLVPGQRYSFRGVFRDVGSAAASAWAEVYLVAEQPHTGVDITGTALPQVNFATADLATIEGLFKSFDEGDFLRVKGKV